MGKLYLVSSGAGGTSYLTQNAIDAIKESDLIVSYTKYAKELKEHIAEKEIFTSGMTKEIERVNTAVEEAHKGRTVALISNGDANVYAMGSLVVEMIDEKNYWNNIEYIALPGITAMLALAAKIGAPISQDFSIISLSDRLTDFDLIEKRIQLSLESDFVIGIYNPLSKTRKEPYRMMLSHLKNYEQNRPVVIASNIGREKEHITISNIKELTDKGVENEAITMSTMLLIGNSNTRLTKNGLVLTPRGYLKKYDLEGNEYQS